MPSVQTRLERLEAAVRGAAVRCVWLYVGWGGRLGVAGAGDGVSRLSVPVRPEVLAPGLMAVLRHPDPGGAEVSLAAAAWALAPLALSPRQRALSALARILVLITAGGSENPAPGLCPSEPKPGARASRTNQSDDPAARPQGQGRKVSSKASVAG